MSQYIQICAAQLNSTVGDITGNSEKILKVYGKACHDKADLVITPELSLTGYPLEDFIKRPDLIAKAQEKAEYIARHTNDVALLFGLPTSCEQGYLYNSAYLAQNGVIKQVFHKRELPNSEVFDEKRYFKKGDAPSTFELNGITLGLAICEDIWHPNVAKAAKAEGAQALLSMNASPYQTNKQELREQIFADRVGDTNLPLLYLNLIGGQDELVFDGQSCTYQNGKVTNLQPMCKESVFSVFLKVKDGNCSFLNEGSVEPLCIEEQIFKAVVLGTKDYYQKNGFKKAVLGLSGGVDSALVLAIGSAALGAENIKAIMMPYEYTSQISIEDAQEIASNYGCDYSVVSIKGMVESYIRANEEADMVIDGVSLENLQSRVRGTQLMAVANKIGAVVLSTGNKSEMAVGYCTLYGDMNGGFNPLKDIPKTMVFRLCNWINKQAGYDIIPERILTRPPSAELAPGQEDTNSLPAYDILDGILEGYVEQDLCAEDIIDQGFEAEDTYKVISLVRQSEFKRRQSAPGVKISPRSFTKAEWRQPLTNNF